MYLAQYKPSLTKHQALEALRTGNYPQTKSAAIGGEQESGFEQAFSSLAYAYLKDKAPKLLKYAIGFQLVERNEDNTKAMAVFGFKLNKQWLYAPVFFLNAALKGHELLYAKKQDMFVPLKENWVNYLLSRSPHILGESSPGANLLGGSSPSIDEMSQSPLSRKYANEFAAQWSHDFLSEAAKVLRKEASFMHKEAAGSSIRIDSVVADPIKYAFAGLDLDLPSFVRKHGGADWLRKAAAACPGLRQLTDKVHGKDTILKLDIESRQKSAASLVTESANLLGVSRRRLSLDGPTSLMTSLVTEKQAADEKIEIISDPGYAVRKGITHGLDEPQKFKLLRDGYLVRDKRAAEEISEVFESSSSVSLQNPSESGVYEMFSKLGKFEKILILKSPCTNAGREPFCLLIRTSKSREWSHRHAEDILHRKHCDTAAAKDWVKNLKTDKPKVGNTYIAVTECLRSTAVFQVYEVFKDGSMLVDFKGCSKPGYRSNRHTVSTWNVNVYRDHTGNPDFHGCESEFYVPVDAKLIRVGKDVSTRKNKSKSIMDEVVTRAPPEDMENAIRPGALEDLQRLFTQNHSRVKLYTDRNEVTIDGEKTGSFRGSLNEGLFSLIRDHGIREKQAYEMLESAQKTRQKVFHVKYAFGFPAGSTPSAPAFPEPNYSTMQWGGSNTRVQQPLQEQTTINGLQGSNTDPSTYDNEIMPDQQTMQAAQQAAQSGQKEVFDTVMIASMLKAVRQDSLVDRFLGDLMKAMDRLGRILFMFYWHQDEFKNRYGKTDLPELEDSTRNSFESLGDLVLYLKEKQVGPSAQFDGPDITEITGD